MIADFLMSIHRDWLFIALGEVYCAIIFWGVFCRSRKGSAETVSFVIRLAFFSLGIASAVGMVAPVMGFVPSVFFVVLAGSFAAVQLATVQVWASGPPAGYRPDPSVPLQRRSTDRPALGFKDFQWSKV